MTEDEYIDATNLTRVRDIEVILRQILPMTEKDETEMRATAKNMQAMRLRLERKIERAVK